MKGKEFSELLADLSDVLRAVHARDAADSLSTMRLIFDSASNRDVSAICSVLRGVRPPEHSNGLRLREMLKLFPALRRFLRRTKASKVAVGDLDAFAAALEEHDDHSASEVTDAAIEKLREQVTAGSTGGSSADAVHKYSQLLEDALTDEAQFAVVFQDLKADPAIKAPDAKKLAKLFAKETARSRDHALKLIWGRHTALMGSKARQKANKGRTAA
jgi:hypothetical protein